MKKRFTGKLPLLLLATFLSASTPVVPQKKHQQTRTPEATQKAEWVVNASYRLAVTVDPGQVKRRQTPVGVEVNFGKFLQARGIRGRLDKKSIRIVRFDPLTGRALPYQDGRYEYSVPYQLDHEFYYKDEGKIWWRIKSETETHFHIYFETLGKTRVSEEPQTVALVGVGDTFHFNNGQAGALDVSMSSAMRYADWDGDGKRDLLVGSHQMHEYGMFDGKIGSVPKFLYFFKNIGSTQDPLFAPGYQIKDESGAYVLKQLGGGPSVFELFDWNEDGRLDIISRNGDASALYMYENTGKRDRDGLPIVNVPQEVLKITITAPQQINIPGSEGAHDYYRNNFKMVDWDGDGDQDILFSIVQDHVEANCDSTNKVCYYDAMRRFFEVHENKGRDANGRLTFASPKVVKAALGSGAALTTFGYELAEYADWNGDGKSDLISGDMHGDPLGASRVLLFENIGTRSEPKFLIERPILSRAEDFDLDPRPLLVDWDDDGDRDLLLCGYTGWAKIYLNINSDRNGVPQLNSGTFVNQAHPKITGGKQTRTAVADWNADGLLDLVQGGIDGWVTFYENLGTNTDPVFKPGVRVQEDGHAIRFINGLRDNPQSPSEPNAGYTVPVVLDFDGDSDLDLIVGDMRGYQTYFENQGTRKHPLLTKGRRIEVDGEARIFGWRNQLGIGDIDDDGKVDIVSTGYADRHLSIYKPVLRQDDPQVLQVTKAAGVKLESGAQLLPHHAGGNNNGDYMTKLVDWDSDGDLDILLGTLYHIWYYENVGTKRVPIFRSHEQINVEGKPLLVSGHAGSVEALDWSGDGRVDLVIGGESGWTHFFERSFIEGNLPRAEIHWLEVRP